MKIMFRIAPRTALIVILSSALLAPAISAKTIETRNERKAQADGIFRQVTQNLEKNGLEKEVASQKALHLFGFNRTEVERYYRNLAAHPGLDIEHVHLIEAFSKRALYGRNIDLKDYHSLTGLVQEMHGVDLSPSQRHAIHEVALLNQAV